MVFSGLWAIGGDVPWFLTIVAGASLSARFIQSTSIGEEVSGVCGERTVAGVGRPAVVVVDVWVRPVDALLQPVDCLNSMSP